jgi:DNA repair exonuclease SbcCD ATPase subunit
MSTVNGLNFCIIDEILESLDTEGLYSFIKNIGKGKTMLFITQHEIKSNIPNNIVVTKDLTGAKIEIF